LISGFFKNVVSISQQTIPLPLIDGIRRRLQSMERDPWDATQDFPDAAQPEDSPFEGHRLLASSSESPLRASNEISAAEYYKILVKTAIAHGGRHGDHQIPVPWLRMILAGLEFRHIEPEAAWYGFEAGVEEAPLAEIPSYDRLFPSAREPTDWGRSE